MSLLFPNALSDPQEYQQAQALWRQLFDRIKCEDYRGPMWTQWASGAYANGTPCYDGSMAIYSQVCEARRKAINVWQVDPNEIEVTGETPATFFDAAMIVRDPEVAKIDTLDITCVLSDENIETAEELIRLYMVDDMTPEALSAVIARRQ